MFAETDKGQSESKTGGHAKIFVALCEEKALQICGKPWRFRDLQEWHTLPP